MSIQDVRFVLVGLATILWPAASLAQQPPIISRSQLLCHTVTPQPRLGNRGNPFRLELQENCNAIGENTPGASYEFQSDGVTRNQKDTCD